MPTLLDMRDFHSYLRDIPFLDSLRSNAVFIPLSRAQGHHSVDSLNAEMTGGLKAKAGVGQHTVTKHALRLSPTARDEVNDNGVRVSQHLSWSDCESHASTALSDGAEDLRAEMLLQPSDVAEVVLSVLSLPTSAEVTISRCAHCAAPAPHDNVEHLGEHETAKEDSFLWALRGGQLWQREQPASSALSSSPCGAECRIQLHLLRSEHRLEDL